MNRQRTRKIKKAGNGMTRTAICLLAGSMAGGLTGCGAGAAGTDAKEPFTPQIVGTYEAEDARFIGNVHAASSRSGYSGTGYATGFDSESDGVAFSISVEETGFYDLVFSSAASDYKENRVFVDGVGYGEVITAEKDFAESTVTRVYLENGEHEVSVMGYWCYIDLDKVTVQTAEPLSEDAFAVSAKLADPLATDSAKRLMSYLADSYGQVVLSGQYCDTGSLGKEFQAVKKVNGNLTPAVLGLDFIEYSPSRVENGSTSRATDFAKSFWENGGIVTFCWHWNAPSKYLTGAWYSGFYKEHTNIDLDKIMNGEDPEGYDLLMQDIDAIAQQLLILQEADVPIIWRPLHEASGGWFWWGDCSAESYKKLYITLFEKLTGEYGIHNLIWLWNGQSAAWYPGDAYVDMIGWDIYPGEHEYGSQIGTFIKASKCSTDRKIITLSENGCVPDPELLKRDGAMWSFWCTWGGEFVKGTSNFASYSDQYTEGEKLAEFYANPLVITQDELPDLKTYPIREDAK